MVYEKIEFPGQTYKIYIYNPDQEQLIMTLNRKFKKSLDKNMFVVYYRIIKQKFMF